MIFIRFFSILKKILNNQPDEIELLEIVHKCDCFIKNQSRKETFPPIIESSPVPEPQPSVLNLNLQPPVFDSQPSVLNLQPPVFDSQPPVPRPPPIFKPKTVTAKPLVCQQKKSENASLA